jgi:ribosome recycling factor
MDLIATTKTKMQVAIEHLKNEMKGIRTGRANTAMLDNITVEIYGSQMRIKDLATLTTPEARLLQISPYDVQNAPLIAKAIERANMGFQPQIDRNVIRIKVPSLDESLRKEMIKICHKKAEESKVSIRNIRRDSNELARKQKANGEIGEDILGKIEKGIQKLTDDFCVEVDHIRNQKEKEVSTI